MAFDIVDRQPGGNSGTISIGYAGEATEIWTIVADNYNYTTEDLRNSGLFPEVYTTFHAQNSRLRLHPIEIQQNDENPALFICTLKWTSDKLDPKEKDEEEDDPLDRRPRITVTTGHLKEVKHRDARGVPKTNIVGDLFDPPIESNASYLIITIRKNVTVFPDWVFDFSDAVNSADFTIKGRLIKAEHAWIANLELGEENTDGPTPYCEAKVEIHLKKKRDAYGDEVDADVPTPWVTEVLNEGLFQKVAGVRQRIKVLDDDGATVNAPAPVPLTLLGETLIPVTEETLTWLQFYDHPLMDFNDISFLWSGA